MIRKGFDAIGLAEQSGHTNVVSIIKELTENKTDLMEHDVKLDEMERVFELMISKAAGIPLSHKKSYFVVKKNCFSGKFFITSFLYFHFYIFENWCEIIF